MFSTAQRREKASGPSWVAIIRSGVGKLDVVVGVLLALVLLPLVIGPFWAVYVFAKDGEYVAAGAIGGIFGGCAILAIRAVRRGEFGPGVLGAALLLAALLLFIATRIPG